jgi:hypothetical protein
MVYLPNVGHQLVNLYESSYQDVKWPIFLKHRICKNNSVTKLSYESSLFMNVVKKLLVAPKELMYYYLEEEQNYTYCY